MSCPLVSCQEVLLPEGPQVPEGRLLSLGPAELASSDKSTEGGKFINFSV